MSDAQRVEADMKATAEILEIIGGLDRLEPGSTVSLKQAFPSVISPTPGASMSLTIRREEDTADGRAALVVAHYQEVNGRSQPDPEIRFEVEPTAWRSGRWETTGMETVTGRTLDAVDAARFATDWNRTIERVWLPFARTKAASS